MSTFRPDRTRCRRTMWRGPRLSQWQPPLDYVLGWAVSKIEASDYLRRTPAAFFGVTGVAACFLLGATVGVLA